MVVRADFDVIWQLDNYNGWNLPYTKTIEIIPRSAEHDREHKFTPKKYKMLVDPTATFTILFVPQFTDFAESDVRTLHYTYYGTEEMYALQGVWVDASMHFDKRDSTSSVYDFLLDITIFVSNSTSPQAGLDGTLGLAISPTLADYDKVCVMHQLDVKYYIPMTYMNFFTK